MGYRHRRYYSRQQEFELCSGSIATPCSPKSIKACDVLNDIIAQKLKKNAEERPSKSIKDLVGRKRAKFWMIFK